MRIGGFDQITSKRDVGRDVVGRRRPDVGRAGRRGVGRAQRAGPLVDVDRPHLEARRPQRHRDGDRPGAAAEVEGDAASAAAPAPTAAAPPSRRRGGRG